MQIGRNEPGLSKPVVSAPFTESDVSPRHCTFPNSTQKSTSIRPAGTWVSPARRGVNIRYQSAQYHKSSILTSTSAKVD